MRYITLITLLLATLLWSTALAQDEAETEPDAIDLYLEANVPEEIDAAPLEEALRDSGDNWQELTNALDSVGGVEATNPASAYSNMLWLINNATHLDRLELSTEVLLGAWDEAQLAQQRFGYDPGSEFFKRYVLNYRLDDEPVTNWRPQLRARFAAADESATGEADVRRVVLAAAEGFTQRERGYFGNLADPVSVANSRAGTGRELALLVAAALRSQGYGTRFVRDGRTRESWVEVYLGDAVAYDPTAWWPVYPQAPEYCGEHSYANELCGGRLSVITAGDAFGQEQVTAHYGPVAGVQVRFTSRGEERTDYEHWSISAMFNGHSDPLDDLYYPDAPGDYPAVPADSAEGRTYWLAAPGDYTLLVGERYPGGVVNTLTRKLSIQPGEHIQLELELDPPAELPLSALVARNPGGKWLYVVHDDSEPSVHARRLLDPIGERDDVTYIPIEYAAAETDPVLSALLTGVLKIKPEDQLPVVVLIINRETKLYRIGYDLSIADWVSRALGD